MTPELYKLFLQMAIIGGITGILGFLSEKYTIARPSFVLGALSAAVRWLSPARTAPRWLT